MNLHVSGVPTVLVDGIPLFSGAIRADLMEAELRKAAGMSGAEGPLRIAVAGGSIGGLCAGLALRGAGFDVQVYERVSGPMGAAPASSCRAN